MRDVGREVRDKSVCERVTGCFRAAQSVHDRWLLLTGAGDTGHGQESLPSLSYVQGDVLEARGCGLGSPLDSRE